MSEGKRLHLFRSVIHTAQSDPRRKVEQVEASATLFMARMLAECADQLERIADELESRETVAEVERLRSENEKAVPYADVEPAVGEPQVKP